jgi:hypothetical protein
VQFITFNCGGEATLNAGIKVWIRALERILSSWTVPYLQASVPTNLHWARVGNTHTPSTFQSIRKASARSRYGQQHVTIYTYSLKLEVMPLK